MVKKKKKKKTKIVDKEKKLQFIRLGWEILHHKFLYYEGAKHGLKCVDDSVYDKIEDEYRALGKELGEEPQAADRVGFTWDEGGACGMIAQHMIATKGKIPSSKIKVEVTKEAKKIIKKVNAFNKALKEVLEEVGLDEKTAKKIRVKIKKRFKP